MAEDNKEKEEEFKRKWIRVKDEILDPLSYRRIKIENKIEYDDVDPNESKISYCLIFKGREDVSIGFDTDEERSSALTNLEEELNGVGIEILNIA